MEQFIKMGQDGRITLPAELRRQLSLDAGVLLRVYCRRAGTIELVAAAEAMDRPRLSDWRAISQALLTAAEQESD